MNLSPHYNKFRSLNSSDKSTKPHTNVENHTNSHDSKYIENYMSSFLDGNVAHYMQQLTNNDILDSIENKSCGYNKKSNNTHISSKTTSMDTSPHIISSGVMNIFIEKGEMILFIWLYRSSKSMISFIEKHLESICRYAGYTICSSFRELIIQYDIATAIKYPEYGNRIIYAWRSNLIEVVHGVILHRIKELMVQSTNLNRLEFFHILSSVDCIHTNIRHTEKYSILSKYILHASASVMKNFKNSKRSDTLHDDEKVSNMHGIDLLMIYLGDKDTTIKLKGIESVIVEAESKNLNEVANILKDS